jgi:dCTP deaminase
MVLSDRQIREQLDSGGIVIDPLGEQCIQPSSVDLHVDRLFRVFRNDTTPYIDPKRAQEDLTELVEVADGGAFILHPGEFVLGSTLERVALGNDLVARLEGKSSLGRLGLLIHSSLPASERVMVLKDGVVAPVPIGDIVKQRAEVSVVGFDPESFEVSYHRVTGWYEGPPDKIYEVKLASGRSVRITAGHNFFTLDRDGNLKKARTGELHAGARVAIPARVPDGGMESRPIDVRSLLVDEEAPRIVCAGKTVERVFAERGPSVAEALKRAGIKHVGYWRGRGQLPLSVLDEVLGHEGTLGEDDRLAAKGARHFLPALVDVDADFAWLLGLYAAEGYLRKNQVTISNTDGAILDRAEATLARLGVPVYRADGVAVTACSTLLAIVFERLGTGAGAHSKRIPPVVFGWPRPLLEAFLEGLVDGDGSRDPTRTSVWTCSDGLAGDVLLLAQRLGLRAGSSVRTRGPSKLWQIYMPTNEHKLLTSVPLPDRLLIELRERTGLSQATASREIGFRHATDLCNIETRTNRDALRLRTLRRLDAAYSRRAECSDLIGKLNRLIEGDLLWDRVVEVRDTGSVEAIYDLEVRPDGRKIENFLAGSGVFVSNTAGFVDAGWDGHLTLELSNVANLPIAIYPGMKIGQISFLQMTSEAERPYGSDETGSKYKGQQGPTPSRYYLNFPEAERKG